jgi:26S proteasome regulatory subunit RPN2 C-terminal domain
MCVCVCVCVLCEQREKKKAADKAAAEGGPGHASAPAPAALAASSSSAFSRAMDTGDDPAAIAAAVGASRPDEDVPMTAGAAAAGVGKAADAPKADGVMHARARVVSWLIFVARARGAAEPKQFKVGNPARVTPAQAAALRLDPDQRYVPVRWVRACCWV